jgi:hypothetical protein
MDMAIYDGMSGNGYISALTLWKFSTISLRPIMPVLNSQTLPKIIKNFRWVLIRRRWAHLGYNPAEVLYDLIKAHDAGTEFPNPTEDHKKLPLGSDKAPVGTFWF